MDVSLMIVAIAGPLTGILYGVYMVIGYIRCAPSVPTKPVAPRRKAISPEIRAEIEQSQDWWDREYHKMVHKTHPETFVVTQKGNVIYEMAFASTAVQTYTTNNYGYYPGCPCTQCLYGRTLGKR